MSDLIVTPRFDASQHLAVVETSPAEATDVERELKKLDLALFIDKEWDAQFGRLVYSVKLFLAPSLPPHLVCDWRDPATREPLPMSFGLYLKVKQQEYENTRRARPLADEVRAENEQRQQRLAEESEGHYRDVAGDLIPAIKGLRSPMFHRPTTAEGIAAARRRATRRDIERKLGLR